MTASGPSTTGPGTLTVAAYLASLPLPVAQLYTGTPTGAFPNIPYAWLLIPGTIYNTPAGIAQAKAMMTAAQLTGWPIDEWIQVEYDDPEKTMADRELQGYAYVPPYGAPNITVGPGLPPPVGVIPNYPSSMPTGWIKVSTDIADYPAFPVVVVPVAPTVWTPDMSVMLSWTTQPTVSNGVVTPGTTVYFFGVMAGQNPPLGTRCAFEGSEFVCAPYPNAEPMGQIKMWLLAGPASTGGAAG